MTGTRAGVDAATFRSVLSQYPTGVCAITAVGADGGPVGMAVGSFTSVSLDPPLVAFLADRSSTTLPKVLAAGRFCVNVLSDRQESVCRALATRGPDKFRDLAWTPTGSGQVRIDGAIAWIDCLVDTVVEAGDHKIVIGAVQALESAPEDLPLLFFRSGYGRFSAGSRVMAAAPDLADQIRRADRARPSLERVADRLSLECVAVAAIDGDVVQVAGAGRPRSGGPPSRVGVRMPLAAPMGAMFVAWADGATTDQWLSRSPEPLDGERRAEYLGALRRLRERGWSVTLRQPALDTVDDLLDALAAGGGDADLQRRLREQHALLGGPAAYDVTGIDPDSDYEVRSLGVPAFDHDGSVSMYAALFGWPSRVRGAQLLDAMEALHEVADALSA